jgi:pyruvate dehydrogenase E2 component (dihydrolipoamide acetyltransferase)/2-oxoisovalerate dehydrogenase E2 component (dihydrolipoyl transacylase)
LKEHFRGSGVKLTYLPFFVKAVVGGLKEVPVANASLDEEAGEIILHDRYHVGIATDTPDGLLVPVLRDADRESLSAVAAEIQRLTEAARNKKIAADDLRGGTFTISSIGGIGGLISTPIINPPEVGILGIGRIVSRPAFDETGNVRPAQFVYLSFSFDHRVMDGADAARFSNAVIARLRNPLTLLVE